MLEALGIPQSHVEIRPSSHHKEIDEKNGGHLAVLLQGGAQTRLGWDGASALARLVDESERLGWFSL